MCGGNVMAFNGFKETSETNENRENSIENNEKRRNQILELPEDYEDDFDSKLDEAETKDENKEQTGDKEKIGWFERIKFLCLKEKNGEQDKNKEVEKQEPKKSRAELFHESIRVDQTPEEIEKYNEELGYSNKVEERPKGGFERERTLQNEDPRKSYVMDENVDDEKNKEV